MDYPAEEATLAASVLQSAPPTLTMRVGDRSYTVEPPDAPITIGREFPAQVQINDPRISRTHLRLEVHAGRWVAFDHSTNGGYEGNHGAFRP